MKEMKKSYNPFKMWGSWVGVVIGTTFGFILTLSIASKLRSPESINEVFWFIYTPVIITFFLIGWGIHSLIRKFRR